MYIASEQRYKKMGFQRRGDSGLVLPPVSLGLWHANGMSTYKETRKLLFHAFDQGIIHFDLANNYGLAPGDAETVFGKIYEEDLRNYRDELIISTKAGFRMLAGSYGEWESKKHLYSSLENSLKKMKLDYFDIFYTHRPDPHTNSAETAEALDLIVRQGKAFYIGISNCNLEESKLMVQLFKERRTPFVIHQMSYNLLNREAEISGLMNHLESYHLGGIAYGPLAEGLLTDKFRTKIPKDFPIHRTNVQILQENLVKRTQEKLKKLKNLAHDRGQTLSQFALTWLLSKSGIMSVVIGTTKIKNLDDNLAAAFAKKLSKEELVKTDQILKQLSNQKIS